MLVEHFLTQANQIAGRTSKVEVSYKTMDKLKRHRWPGNVRELKNFVERAVLLTQNDTIETKFLHAASEPSPASLHSSENTAQASSLPMVELALEENMPFKDAKNRLVEQFELEYWSRLLESTDGNVSKAARIAGVHRKSVEYILKKLDLSREDIGINPS